MSINSSETLVSIITVVYNGALTLEQTINSVLNQKYRNIEYIIIDGGSTDHSVDIIKKYENKISYWVSEKDNGLYDAMNKGILKASGTLIGMINSDDWFEENAVQLVVDAYNQHLNKRIFHGDRFDVLENGDKVVRRFHPSPLKLIYYGMTYNHPSMFVHKEIYSKCLYNSSMRSLADYQFVLTQYLERSTSFHYIAVPYVNYRLTGISSNLSLRKAIKEGFLARKLAGLSLIQNLISVFIRIVKVCSDRLLRLFINK